MEIKQEQVTTTTTVTVNVTELEAIARNRPEALAALLQRQLNNGHRPDGISPEAKIVVNEPPAPANRLPQNAGGKPLARCPKCHTDMVYYKLDSHIDCASCKARQKRNAAAERRQRKIMEAARMLNAAEGKD